MLRFILYLTIVSTHLAKETNADSKSLPPKIRRDLLLAEANRALDEKNIQAAARLYEQIESLSLTHSGEFYARLGRILYEAGRYNDARAATLKYLKRDGVQGRWYSQAILLLSRISARLKSLNSSTPTTSPATKVVTVVQQEPQEPKAFETPNREIEARNMFMKAMHSLRQMPTTTGNGPLKQPKAKTFLRWDSLRRAVQLWESILQKYPDTAIAKYLQGPKNPLSLDLIRRELNELATLYYPGAVLYDKALKAEFLLVPGGEFEMGGGPRKDQNPPHTVRLNRSFYLMQTELTQSQWESVTATNPAWFSTCGPNCPVEQISHDDVQDFVQALNKTAGRSIYRLPSEAEWEYAASMQAPTTEVQSYAWYDDNSDMVTHSVCLKEKTGYGFCDLFGNVWEWVADDYQYEAYNLRTETVIEDPVVKKGKTKVFRGGSYDFTSAYLTPRRRYDDLPSFRAPNIGARLIRVVP